MAEKTILNFLVELDLLARVDEFWHEHRFQTRAEAVRWLITAALDKKLAPKKGETK